jgi:ribosomal protein S18 acetylase RimI-like enzyme
VSPRSAAGLEIRPLTGERLPDVAELFGQGGDPKWCWCASFRVRDRDFHKYGPEQNRAVLEDATERADAGSGEAPGLIAYRDGRVVGWVSLGPREDFIRLAYSKVLAPVDDRSVWSVVCFVVARADRGQGVARALLDAAVAYARERGATTLEAYPLHESQGRVGAAYAYAGTQAMFERAGFGVVATRRMNAVTAPRPIVRLDLGD